MSKPGKYDIFRCRFYLVGIAAVFLSLLSGADRGLAQAPEAQFGFASVCEQENPLGSNRYVICERYVKQLPAEESEALYFLRQRVEDLIVGTTSDSDWALGRLVLTTWVIAIVAVLIAALVLLSARWAGLTRVATMLFSVSLIIIAVATSFGYSKQYSATITYRLQLIALRDAIDVEFVNRVSRLSSQSNPIAPEQRQDIARDDEKLATLMTRYTTISDAFATEYGGAFSTIALPSLLGS